MGTRQELKDQPLLLSLLLRSPTLILLLAAARTFSISCPIAHAQTTSRSKKWRNMCYVGRGLRQDRNKAQHEIQWKVWRFSRAVGSNPPRNHAMREKVSSTDICPHVCQFEEESYEEKDGKHERSNDCRLKPRMKTTSLSISSIIHSENL